MDSMNTSHNSSACAILRPQHHHHYGWPWLLTLPAVCRWNSFVFFGEYHHGHVSALRQASVELRPKWLDKHAQNISFRPTRLSSYFHCRAVLDVRYDEDVTVTRSWRHQMGFMHIIDVPVHLERSRFLNQQPWNEIKPLQYDSIAQLLVDLLELLRSWICVTLELLILLSALIFRANSDGKCIEIRDQMFQNKIKADRKIVYASGFRICLIYFSDGFVSLSQFVQTLSDKNYHPKTIVFQ